MYFFENINEEIEIKNGYILPQMAPQIEAQ